MYSLVLANLIKGVRLFLEILSYLIIADALLSWILPPSHTVRELIGRFIGPLIEPFRRITDKLNTSSLPIDFSPILAYFTIMLLVHFLEILELQLY